MAELGPIQAPGFLKPIESASALSIRKTRPEVPETGQTDFGNVMKTKAPEKSETVSKETGAKDLPDEKLKSESSAKEDPPVPTGTSAMKKMAGRREKEMLKFMDSMESELGVPPEEILVAMSKLAPEDLKKSPEASAELIIRNLDLSKEDEAKALSLFAGMLVATKAPEFFQKPEVAAAAVASAAVATVPRVDELIESLEQMNRKFFPQPAKEIQPKTEREVYVQAKEMAREQQHIVTPEKLSSAVSVGTGEGIALPKESLVKPTDFKKVVAELKKATGETSTAAVPEAPMGSSLEDQLKALMGKQESSNGEKFSQGGDKSAVKEQSVPTETDPTKFFVPTDGPAPSSALRVDNKILPAALKISPESKTQNIEALSQQARILVKDGGGEAVVKLNPEGLGEVQLTVQVKDGRVSVAMSAETKEAKKSLESAVSDLRESLTSHKLSVEKIQVDVGNQTSSDSRSQSDSQQRGLDLRADVGRDQARQFMGQFREDTASRRDPFIEMPGIRGYVQPNSTPGPIPAYESGATVRRYSGAMTGERVNLVG